MRTPRGAAIGIRGRAPTDEGGRGWEESERNLGGGWASSDVLWWRGTGQAARLSEPLRSRDLVHEGRRQPKKEKNGNSGTTATLLYIERRGLVLQHASDGAEFA